MKVGLVQNPWGLGNFGVGSINADEWSRKFCVALGKQLVLSRKVLSDRSGQTRRDNDTEQVLQRVDHVSVSVDDDLYDIDCPIDSKLNPHATKQKAH